MITDAANRILEVNPAFTRITGYSAAEVAGKTPHILASGRHPADFYRQMWQEIIVTGHWEGEIWNRRKNGEIFAEWLVVSAVRDAHGEVVNYIAQFSDVTEEKRSNEIDLAPGELRQSHAAPEPPPLPRPARAGDQEGEARAARRGAALHRSRPVQGGQRHARARRRRPDPRPGGARASCAPFATRTPWPASAATSSRSCSPTSRYRSAPSGWPRISFARSPSRSSSTRTASTSPRRSASRCTRAMRRRPRRCCSNADQAMYLAKTRGAGPLQRLRGRRAGAVQRHRRLAVDIHQALANEEFVLQFQPVVDLRTGRDP